MKNYDIYGVGNALVDIQVKVDFEFLSNHGIQKGVMTLVTPERQAELLGLLEGHNVQVSSGGSACNTVVGVANFGGRAYYAGKVGTDRYGDFFQQELQELGVRSDLPPEDMATGTCLVMITPDADRTMQTCLAASVELDEEDIAEEHLKQARFVYVEGYLWDSPGPRHASQEAMALARVHRIPVAFSYSDPFCVQRATEDFRELTRSSIDLVFCNVDEAHAITGHTDRVGACRTIAGWGARVFMTAGADGAYYGEGDRVEHIPSFPVDAVDTNGAGDLFAGGTLFGLAAGYSPLEAGTLGAYAAAQVVSQLGPRLPHRLNDKVSEILTRRSVRA